MTFEVIRADTPPHEVLEAAWADCKMSAIVDGLWVGERTAQKWREPISPTESGIMNPLGRADKLIEVTQKQSPEGALRLLAWLLINFIRRSLPPGAGNAQVIWRLETVFSDLRLKVVCALSEEEQRTEK